MIYRGDVFMIVISENEPLDIVTIDGLDYIKTELENSILLESIQKDKDGYYMSMEIPNRTEENDRFKEITKDFFMREII